MTFQRRPLASNGKNGLFSPFTPPNYESVAVVISSVCSAALFIARSALSPTFAFAGRTPLRSTIEFRAARFVPDGRTDDDDTEVILHCLAGPAAPRGV